MNQIVEVSEAERQKLVDANLKHVELKIALGNMALQIMSLQDQMRAAESEAKCTADVFTTMLRGVAGAHDVNLDSTMYHTSYDLMRGVFVKTTFDAFDPSSLARMDAQPTVMAPAIVPPAIAPSGTPMPTPTP